MRKGCDDGNNSDATDPTYRSNPMSTILSKPSSPASASSLPSGLKLAAVKPLGSIVVGAKLYVGFAVFPLPPPPAADGPVVVTGVEGADA